MRALVLISSSLLAGTAFAAPYSGVWAADGRTCDESITITDTAVHGLENRCEFTSVVGEYSIEAACFGEGFEYSRGYEIRVLDSERLTIAKDGGDPIYYSRCE